MSDGWFVVNVRDAEWLTSEGGDLPSTGSECAFETDEHPFEQLGVRLHVLPPGEPNGFYHHESAQEDFLVLSGECTLLVEGEERRLQQWDFFHSPPETDHIIIGAGSGPSVVLAVGARLRRKGLVYPVSDLALEHGAGVSEETSDASEAYGSFSDWKRSQYQEGWLPDL